MSASCLKLRLAICCVSFAVASAELAGADKGSAQPEPKSRGTPLTTAGDVVTMKPFVVEEMKTWMTVERHFDADHKLTEAKVTAVRAGRPYAEAGLKRGMLIKGVLILPAAEKVPENTGWDRGDIVLKVQDGSRQRELIVPAETLRRAFRLAAARADALSKTP